MTDLRLSIIQTAGELGIDPVDLATAMSYETGGTFDEWAKGPTTKWGTHRGLIQWGEPQAAEYGVYEGMPVDEQVRASGRYLRDRGVQPGMGLLDIYSAINAGGVGLYDRSDAHAGGAPGTVRDKVEQQMEGHRENAVRLLGTAAAPNPGAAYADTEGTPVFNGTAPYATVTPPDVRTAREQAEFEEMNKPYSFTEAIGASVQSDWATSWMLRDLGDRAVDPDFSWDPKTFNETVKAIPEQYHDYVQDAHSSVDAAARVQWAQEDAVRERKLSDMGMTGLGIRLATTIFDPTALAATVLSEGLAAPVIATAKAGRVGRILLESGIVGGGNAVAEGVSAQWNPKVTEGDIVAAFGLGAVMGGAVGALRRNPHTRAEADAMGAIGRNMQRDLSVSTALQAPGPGSAGAAEAPGSALGQHSFIMGDRPDIGDAPEAALTHVGGVRVRYDSGGQLGSSESAISRTVAAHFGEEAVGFKDRSVVPDAATTVQRVIHGRYIRDWNTIAFPAFKKWAQEQGKWGRRTRHQAWEEFNTQVADFVEDTAPRADTAPEVKAAAGEFRRVMNEYADLMSNPLRDKGGAGRPISEVQPDPNYVAKYANHESINDKLERFGERKLVDFVRQAVFAKRPDMKPELADRIAEGWLKNIVKAGYGMEDRASLAVAQADRDMLRQAFAGTRLADDELDLVFDQIDGLKQTKDGDSGFSRTRRRTLLAYSFEADIDGQRISMRDFFMRDADFVMNRYSRQTSGRVALAQMQVRDPATGDLVIDGIRTPAEFEKLLDWVREEWREMPGKSQAQKESGARLDTENLKYLWDSVTGTPHYNPRTEVYQWMRRARELNFVRLMNRMGITQAQEISRMMGSLGVKALMQQVPALKRVIDSAGRSVSKNDRLLQELEAATGKGMEMDFGRYRFRYEDQMIGTQNYGKAGRTIDRMLETGKRVTADISLMTHVQSIQQKWTLKAVSQRMYDMARKTSTGNGFDLDKLGGKDLAKLRAIGMSDDALRDVFAAMLQHGEKVKDSRLTALNMDRWAPETRARFVNTLTRWADRVIHQNDAASLNRWMSQPIVQMMTQFRAFIIGSWAKSTLYNVHHFDARTFGTMMLEVMAGTGTWALTQGSAAVLRPDRDEYLAERLSVDNLARAGFGRAAFMSMMPAIMDTALTFTPIGPAFDYRTSATPTDFWFGSPSVDLLDSLATFASGTADAALSGRPVSQQEIQAGARSLPFANWLPFSAILSYLISDQPKYEPRD